MCKQCKPSLNCCINANPPITSKRRKIIEAYLKMQKLSIADPFTKTTYTFPKADKEGYCIFFDKKTGKCLIHPVKPETCVAGPITFDINVGNQKIEWYLKKEEICSLAGMLYEYKQLLQRHLALAKKEILTLVRELDADALKTILQIEEPDTFKIDEDGIEKSVLGKLTNAL